MVAKHQVGYIWGVEFDCAGVSPDVLARASAIAMRFLALKGVHPYAAARAVFCQEGDYELSDAEWLWADAWRTAEELGIQELGHPARGEDYGGMNLVWPAAVLARRPTTADSVTSR